MLKHINYFLFKKVMALKMDGIFISCVPRTIKTEKKTFTLNEGIIVSEGRPEFVQFLADESQKVTIGELIELDVRAKYDEYNERVTFIEVEKK